MVATPPPAGTSPTATVRAAGGLLVVVGGANAVIGLWALLVAVGELGPGMAVALTAAGAATTVLGVLVWRGNRRALLFAIALFAVLLVSRLATASDAPGAVVSLVLLVVVVAVLAVAAVGTRSRQ